METLHNAIYTCVMYYLTVSFVDREMKYFKRRLKMVIAELRWIMDNRSLLDNEDYLYLQIHDVFNQYDNGELAQNGMKMIEILGIVVGMYEKYHRQ